MLLPKRCAAAGWRCEERVRGLSLCVGVALALGCGLVLVGCSANYNGERLFWKAQQVSAPITKHQGNVPPEQFAQALQSFERVIREAPGTVWAARAQLAVGSIYSLQASYPKAREAYALVLKNHNQFQDLVFTARLATAKTYEIEKNWLAAVKTYYEITDYHPWIQVGLEAPLYIAVQYQSQGASEEANKALDRAIGIYTKLIPKAPTPELASKVKGYLAQTYERLSRWEEAVKLLREILDAPKGANRPLAYLMLGSIYQTRLNDMKKAEEVYAKLIQEYPNEEVTKLARVQLEHLRAAGQSPKPAPSSGAGTAPSAPAAPPLPSIPEGSPVTTP